MPTRPPHKITKRMVDRVSADRKAGAFWDRDLPGFGVRVYRSGRTTYVVQARGPHGSTRVTLGRHGKLSAAQARKRAAVAIERIKAGREPIETPPEPMPDPTVADLAQRCLRVYVDVRCKPLTARGYRQHLRLYILPALGHLPVRSVAQEHIEALHYSLRERPGAANVALGVLSRMFTLAEAWGWRPGGSHPCKSVRKYKARYRERFLTRQEYRRAGRVLREADARGSPWPASVAAIRLIMLTGCRCEEIATLRWDDVDRSGGYLRLRETKTGLRLIPLTPAALEVLDGIERVAGNPWVFVGLKPASHVSRIRCQWHKLRVQAGLHDVRLHDLRHSYASRALALGESLAVIGKLLGHAKMETTARYAHLAQGVEKIAVARIAASIEANILPPPARNPEAEPSGQRRRLQVSGP